MKGLQVLLAITAVLFVSQPVSAAGFSSPVTVTTDASGDATAYSQVLSGRVIFIWYQDGFDDTADFTITCENTAEGVWTESNVTAAKITAPTKLVQDQVGVNTTQRDYVWCVNDRVKIVIAQGGNTLSATFLIAWF